MRSRERYILGGMAISALAIVLGLGKWDRDEFKCPDYSNPNVPKYLMASYGDHVLFTWPGRQSPYGAYFSTVPVEMAGLGLQEFDAEVRNITRIEQNYSKGPGQQSVVYGSDEEVLILGYDENTDLRRCSIIPLDEYK